MTAPPALGHDLSYDRTVARGHVHVRSLSEIFISDSVRDGDSDFVAALQLPRTHGLWGDREGSYHDPVVTLEVGRQAVFRVLHHYCEVPLDWKFILRRVDFRVVDLESYRDNQVTPPEGFARVRLISKTQKHGLLDASFDGDIVIGDSTAMVMSADITVMSPYNFRLLRAKGRGRKPLDAHPLDPDPTPVEPGLVGRTDPRNVVLYDLDTEAGADEGGDPDARRYGLIVNEAHPAFFDHPHDHVTGSLILEFCRQAGIATARRVEALSAGALVTGCSMTFKEFAELDSRTECLASVARVSGHGDVLVDLALLQFGERIAEIQLQLSEQPVASDLPLAKAAASG